jgi:hypothetical protein
VGAIRPNTLNAPVARATGLMRTARVDNDHLMLFAPAAAKK